MAGVSPDPNLELCPRARTRLKPLDMSTWDAFARLVERHNGVFGGCWCTWFHTFHAEKAFTR